MGFRLFRDFAAGRDASARRRRPSSGMLLWRRSGAKARHNAQRHAVKGGPPFRDAGPRPLFPSPARLSVWAMNQQRSASFNNISPLQRPYLPLEAARTPGSPRFGLPSQRALLRSAKLTGIYRHLPLLSSLPALFRASTRMLPPHKAAITPAFLASSSF